MTQETTNYVEHSFSPPEELHPIRIGTIARQSDPDASALLYVALISLLPAELHMLCACAGLFYARILRVDGDRYHLEVAALPHYFEADRRTRERHVRPLILSFDDFAHLLEYDRSVAGKATGDVREVVEEHVKEVTRSQHAAAHKEAMNVSPPAPLNDHQPTVNDVSSQEDAVEEKEEADLEILTHVFVARWRIQQIFDEWQIQANTDRHQRGPDRRIQSVLLQAALEVFEGDQAMTNKIKAVRHWRRKRRNEGYPWQRVVTLAPVASGTGWDLVIGKPAA